MAIVSNRGIGKSLTATFTLQPPHTLPNTVFYASNYRLEHPMTRIHQHLLLACLLVVISSGCSSMAMFNGEKLPTDPSLVNPNTKTYSVAMKKDFGKPTVYTGNFDKPITVQQALEDSGAIKQFRSMEVNLIRKLPKSGKPLTMPVDYQARKKRVRPEQDYALHDGDRILVQPKQGGSFGNVIKMLGAN